MWLKPNFAHNELCGRDHCSEHNTAVRHVCKPKSALNVFGNCNTIHAHRYCNDRVYARPFVSIVLSLRQRHHHFAYLYIISIIVIVLSYVCVGVGNIMLPVCAYCGSKRWEINVFFDTITFYESREQNC